MSWRQEKHKAGHQQRSNKKTQTSVLIKLIVVDSTNALNVSKAQSSLTHKHAQLTAPRRTWQESEAWISVDTEAGMLSGMSRKRSIRSNPYWFTEFCNSQCLSHFAAPFIVVRAETSVAESCAWCNRWTGHQRAHKRDMCVSQIAIASQQKVDKAHLSWSTTRELTTRKRQSPYPRREAHKRGSQWNGWIRVNDPSAGSPTETLLRLLLPLSDKVH